MKRSCDKNTYKIKYDTQKKKSNKMTTVNWHHELVFIFAFQR